MEPTRDTHATLVDLLDRVLDKGLVINADLIVSLAGIPLIGINLRAALAGMETMIQYGVMRAWDERTRAWEREHRKDSAPALTQGEELIQRIFGSYYYGEGIYAAWRSGTFYLTSRRLFLHHRDFDEVIFQTPLEKIRGLVVKADAQRPADAQPPKEDHFIGEQREGLCLLLEGDKADEQRPVARLRTADVARLKALIEAAMGKIGIAPEENPALPEFEERVVGLLTQGEQVVHQGEMWYLMVVPAPGRAMTTTWKPGRLYLTNKRLCWWYDFEQKFAFQVPVDEISKVTVEPKDTGGMLKHVSVLTVSHNGTGEAAEASFSGSRDELSRWERALNEVLSKMDRETCPRCGRGAPVKELLESGCARCGWASPRRAEAVIA